MHRSLWRPQTPPFHRVCLPIHLGGGGDLFICLFRGICEGMTGLEEREAEADGDLEDGRLFRRAPKNVFFVDMFSPGC